MKHIPDAAPGPEIAGSAPAKRKYHLSPRALAARRANITKALAAPKHVTYRPTEKRQAASRANLQKAIAARNRPEGNANARLNALKHGLNSRRVSDSVRRLAEDPEEFRDHLERFRRFFMPRGPVETRLVRRLAETFWRRLRLYAAQVETETRVLKNCVRLVAGPDWLHGPDGPHWPDGVLRPNGPDGIAPQSAPAASELHCGGDPDQAALADSDDERGGEAPRQLASPGQNERRAGQEPISEGRAGEGRPGKQCAGKGDDYGIELDAEETARRAEALLYFFNRYSLDALRAAHKHRDQFQSQIECLIRALVKTRGGGDFQMLARRRDSKWLTEPDDGSHS